MSGGSFDFAYSRASMFADELHERLAHQGEEWPERGHIEPCWAPEVAARLAHIADLAEYVAHLMYEAEWLYSGDTGEDSFQRRLAAYEAQHGRILLQRPD